MTFTRVKNPIGLDYIKHLLNPGERFVSAAEMAEELKALLMKHPANTFYLVGSEEEDIQVFILAFVSPQTNHKAIVFQSYTSPLLSDKSLDTAFLRLMWWAEQNDVKEIRMDTDHSPLELMTKWGFEPAYTVMKLSVPEGVEKLLLKTVHQKETLNASEPKRHSESNEPAVESDAASSSANGRERGSVEAGDDN